MNYSAYDRELTVIYEAIRYFSYLLEGREFKVLTDHKPLIYAFNQRPEKASPRQLRQLTLIAQFTTNIEYVKGPENDVADVLSRIESLRLPCEISLSDLANAQKEDEQLAELIDIRAKINTASHWFSLLK